MSKPSAITFLGDERTLRSWVRKSIRRGIAVTGETEQIIEDKFMENVIIKADTGNHAIDHALGNQRTILFQAMGILALATDVIRDSLSITKDATNIWTALEGAYSLVDGVSDRIESIDTLLAGERVSVNSSSI